MEFGNPHESHDELIELVACPKTGFFHLFSGQQLQVSCTNFTLVILYAHWIQVAKIEHLL